MVKDDQMSFEYCDECRRYHFTMYRLHCASRVGRVSLLSQDCPLRPGGPPRSRDYMLAPGGYIRHANYVTTSDLIKNLESWSSRSGISRRSWRAKSREASGAFCSGKGSPKKPLLAVNNPGCPPRPQAEMPRPRPVPRHKWVHRQPADRSFRLGRA